MQKSEVKSPVHAAAIAGRLNSDLRPLTSALQVLSAQTEGVMTSCEHSAGGPLSRPPLFSQALGSRLRRRRAAYEYAGDERGPKGARHRRRVQSQISSFKFQVSVEPGREVVEIRGRRQHPYPFMIASVRCESCGTKARIPDEFIRERTEPLFKFCLALARKRYHKRNGGTCVRVEKQAVKYAKGYDRIAAVVAKTYAVMGDEAFKSGIPNDVAVVMIQDVLNDIDPTLIERNAKKKLSRPKSG